MGKFVDFLSGMRILGELESPINGRLTVIHDLAWGTYIKAGGVTQSGGILEKIWSTTLKTLITSHQSQVSNCLVLGLGGGSVARLVRRYWSEAEITGVDIDPMMVELGKKYLGLNKAQVKVKVQDAYDFCAKRYTLNAIRYDLVCIDLYLGDQFPEKFESEIFLRLVLRQLTPNGVAIFNRLYGVGKQTAALKFAKKLERIFTSVDYVHPGANLMLICFK